MSSLDQRSDSTAWLDPPVPRNAAGEIRKVGVELELTDLDVAEIAETVRDVLGGAIERETDYVARVEVPRLGTFRVEADAGVLRRIGRRREAHLDPSLASAARDAFANLVETVAPFEVITPPLPYPELPIMDELAMELRRRGGRDTKAGLLSALALQLNPEVPRLTAESIHAHLRAFVAVEPWLRMRLGIDVSRRATWYVDRYPEAYIRHLLAQDQVPSMASLIDDYLEYNPTRNRALDMLPLFAHIDETRVHAAVADPRIKSRPTFHYRLPDCRLSDPEWRVTDEWRYWLQVERAAADPALLRELAGGYLQLLVDRSLSSPEPTWARRSDALLSR